jgi:hypothetical protein
MSKRVGLEVAKCPKCTKPIGSRHPYTWCSECGEPLPKAIVELLRSQPSPKPESLKPDWSSKPRSLRWKFAASLIWIGACVSVVALVIVLSMPSSAPSLSADVRMNAANELAQTTLGVTNGAVIGAIAGVLYIVKRPKQKRG